MPASEQADAQYYRERLETISRGFVKAIEREVRRLEEMGFPMHVGKDGKVITIEPKGPRGNGSSAEPPADGGNGAGTKSS